jgi:hypothetical protein
MINGEGDMPAVSASGAILSGSATYEATDWASVGGGGSLDLLAAARLERGIDLALGAEALVGLDASVAKFIAADLKGQANAAARVRAQVQVPLDLFNEAGLAIRLQAVAEAAVGVELDIGLSAADFVELAAADPRMRGVALRLLTALLAEAKIQGGVRAKAAVAAMAYANVALTGRLIQSVAGAGAGFTVSAEAGLGLSAGAGFRVFARFGIDEPGRLVRRCTDIVVDDVLDRLGTRVGSAAERSLLDELRTPAKIALRTCYELGAELGRNASFSAANAPVIAQRCLEVALEEIQRDLLARLASMGIQTFESALRAMGFAQSAWDVAHAERIELASQLRAMSDDPFEPKAANVDYWSGLVDRGLALALALGGRNDADQAWVRPLATVWAAAQLAFVAIERISSSGVRGSLFNQASDLPLAPFRGSAQRQPPQLIRRHICATLRPGQPVSDCSLEDLANFLLTDAIVDQLVAHDASVARVLAIVDQQGEARAVMATVFTHIGGFVGQSGGRVDAVKSLDVILAGLQHFVGSRLRSQIEPVLRSALAADDPDLRIYVDDVLLASIGFSTSVVFQRARDWAAGAQTDLTTLREACSAVVMNFFGRSLVVTADVLMHKALQQMSGSLRATGAALNQPDGIVERLARLVPEVNRDAIHDGVAEIFDLAADVFQPWPDAKRARIRELMYRIINTAPAGSDADYMVQLANAAFVPNAQAASELALELGGLIRDNFGRLIERLIERFAEQVIELLQDAIEFAEAQIVRWLDELQTLLNDALRALQALLHEIERLRRLVADAADAMLDQAERFLGVLGNPSRRNALRRTTRAVVKDACVAVLEGQDAYRFLPQAGQELVRGALGGAIDAVLDNVIVDEVARLLGGIAGELESLLADAREIDPSDDVAGALLELLVDRVEDAIRGAFGNQLHIPIGFRVRGHYDGPRLDTPVGSFRPRIDIDLNFELGEVRIEVADLVRVLRQWVRGLQAITGAAHDFGASLMALLTLERQLEANEVAVADTQARHDAAVRRKRETLDATASVRILHPGPAAAYGGDVPVEIALDGVPHGFLGREAQERQRVLVFLNDVSVPASSFDVVMPSEVTLPAGTAATIRMAGYRREAHPLVAQKTTARARHSVRARHGHMAILGVGRVGVLDGHAFFPSSTLGRKPQVSVTDKLGANGLPALLLRGHVAPASLHEGLNSLTVVVINGRSSDRLTHSVVFQWAPAAIAKAGSARRAGLAHRKEDAS